MIYLNIISAILILFTTLHYFLKDIKKSGKNPQNFSELFRIWAHKKKSPNKKAAALIYATSVVFVFGIWEAFLRVFFKQVPHQGILVLTLLIFIVYAAFLLKKIHEKSASKLAHQQSTYITFSLFFLMSLQAYCSCLLVGWIFLRSRFIKKNQINSVSR